MKASKVEMELDTMRKQLETLQEAVDSPSLCPAEDESCDCPYRYSINARLACIRDLLFLTRVDIRKIEIENETTPESLKADENVH